MNARRESEVAPMTNRTTVERTSEREVVVTRMFNGPARLVWEAWTKAELFRAVVGAEVDGNDPAFLRAGCSCGGHVPPGVRTRRRRGGVLRHVHGSDTDARLVWTNEESDEGPITTVTFAENGGKTLLVMHQLYPSKEALDAGGGASDAMAQTYEQLDELLVTLGANAERS